MGLGIFDYIKWNGDMDLLAYRCPKANLGKYTKLQVTDAQEAVVVVNGESMQKFGPGTHELDSPNVPVLKAFYGMLNKGGNPYVVQVWFVQKTCRMNVEWDVDAFSIYDPDFKVSIPIIAKGRYGITVVDAERLIRKLAWGYPSGIVSVHDFTDQAQGQLTARTKSLITKIITMNRIGINKISAHLDDISQALQQELSVFWTEYGCRMLGFDVTKIGIDENDPIGSQIYESIKEQTSQRLQGYTWQQKQVFSTARQAIDGMSNGSGGLIGAVMATSMMGGMGGGLGSGMMAQPTNLPGCDPQASQAGQESEKEAKPVIREVFCSNCNRKYPSNVKFCPHCGDPYNPCPKCGADNDLDAKVCTVCGLRLDGDTASQCPNCHNAVAPGAVFCPHCGRPLAEESCPRCGAPACGVSFCPRCGFKIK